MTGLPDYSIFDSKVWIFLVKKELGVMLVRWLKTQYKNQPAPLWVIVSVTFTMWLGLGATMPIRTIYAEREGSSLTEIGLMGSAYLLAQFVFQLPFGRLNDKWGRRPFILFAVVAHTILSAAYIFLNSPLLFIIIRALEGVGTAAFMPAARAYISDVIPRNKRGEAFGLFGAAASGGILLGPAAGGFIGGAFGFTMPFIFCAATGVIGLLLAIFLLPESIHNQIEPAVAPRLAPLVKAPLARWFGVYFLGACFMLFTLQFVMSLLGTVWNIWLNDQGDSLNQIGLTYTVFGLPSLFFTPYFGRLIDRSQNQAYLYLVGGIGITSVYAGYAFAAGNFGLIVGLSLLESLMFSMLQPISDRFTAEIIPANARGTGQALFSTFSTLGGFVGAMLTTIVYQFWIGAPFIAAAGVVLAGTVVGSMVMWRYERRHRPLRGEPPALEVTKPEEAELVSSH